MSIAIAAYWMRGLLVVAGLYNIAWAALFVFYPLKLFQVVHVTLLASPPLLRTLGVGVGAFGAAYLLAAREPVRYWPIVAAGLVGKVVSPLGFAYLALRHVGLWSVAWVIVFNDIIWWAPFGLILSTAYKRTNAKQR